MATADRNQMHQAQDAAPAAADATDALQTPPLDTPDSSDAPETQTILLDPDTTNHEADPLDGAADLLEDDGEGGDTDEHGRRLQPAHEFLVPGPDATSDSGTLRWGITWIVFSLLLILFMLAVSFICWLLASWTGLG